MGVQFCTPPPKKDPYKTQQKWVKCCMKAPIRHALLQTSQFIVQLSTRRLKTPSWTFFVNHLQMDGFLAIMKSLPSVPSTSCLSTATWRKVFFLFNIFLLFFKKNIYIHTNVNYNNITKQRHILVKTYYNTILSLSTKRIKVFIVKAKTPS